MSKQPQILDYRPPEEPVPLWPVVFSYYAGSASLLVVSLLAIFVSGDAESAAMFPIVALFSLVGLFIPAGIHFLTLSMLRRVWGRGPVPTARRRVFLLAGGFMVGSLVLGYLCKPQDPLDMEAGKGSVAFIMFVASPVLSAVLASARGQASI